MSHPNTNCQLYGCNRTEKPGATVELSLSEGDTTVRICEFHQVFFEDTTPDHYAIGRTFTGEIEIRPVPALPTTPAPEEEA